MARPVIVSPDAPRPTHHLRLVGGGKDIGLILCNPDGKPNPYAINRDRLQSTSLKISQGDAEYSDYELPFTPVAQQTWSGGRALESLDDDITRFFDSYNLNTMFSGKAFLGPLVHVGKGNRELSMNWPGSVSWQAMLGSRRILAAKFTPANSYTAQKISVLLKKKGTPADLKVEIWSHDSVNDQPSAKLDGFVFSASTVDVVGKTRTGSLPLTVSLTGGTAYWLYIEADAGDGTDDHWLIGVDANSSPPATKESSDGVSWIWSGVDLYYLIRDNDETTPDRVFFFTYKGGLYCITDIDGSGPKLWLNGDRGVADANTGNLTRLNDGSKSWAVNEWAGCVVLITAGPGSLEERPWRTIISNDATYLVVDEPWKVEHTTATEYVILGADKWQQLGSIGTDSVYDVLVVDDRFYLARGSANFIMRVRFYNNAGAWTMETQAESVNSNYADRLALVHHNDTTIGKRQIWRALNDNVEISRGDVPAWGTDITFGAAIQVGDKEDKIQRLIEYVNPSNNQKILWVMKKGSVWAVSDDIPDMIQLKEMRTVTSENNSRAALVHNLYLYFSLLQGLERFYENVVDDIGPNRDRGFPPERQGSFYMLEGYPGRFFGAYNAGSDGYSAVLANNGAGWHEYYRSDERGQDIKGLAIQVVPGSNMDRLWFIEGNTFRWLGLPSETLDPLEDPNFEYTWEGYLVTPRIYVRMTDITKLYDSLKIMADNLQEDVCWIEADYLVDDEGAEWTPLPNTFTQSPSQEINLVERGKQSVTGKFLMLRLRFISTDKTKTPELNAYVLNIVSRIPTKFGYVATVRLDARPRDLNGEPDAYHENGLDKIADLDELADSLQVLEMSSTLKLFHGKRVFIDAPTLRPLYESGEGEGYIGILPITQVGDAEEA